MSFVADLWDAIHGFHFADRRLSQLPTPQTASSSSHNHRAGLRCFCLWGFISDSSTTNERKLFAISFKEISSWL